MNKTVKKKCYPAILSLIVCITCCNFQIKRIKNPKNEYEN